MEKEKVEKIKELYLMINNFIPEGPFYRLDDLIESLIKELISIQDISETEIKFQSVQAIDQLIAISGRELEFVKLSYKKCSINAPRVRFKELEKEIDKFKMQIYLSKPIFISDLN